MGWKPPPLPRRPHSFQEIMKLKEKSTRRSLRLNKLIIIFNALASILLIVSAIMRWQFDKSTILTFTSSICFVIPIFVALKARSNLVNKLNSVMVENIMES